MYLASGPRTKYTSTRTACAVPFPNSETSRPGADTLTGYCHMQGNENEGFELQTTFAAPLRPVLPRFPLLPVAMRLCLQYENEFSVFKVMLGLCQHSPEHVCAAVKGGKGDLERNRNQVPMINRTYDYEKDGAHRIVIVSQN